MKQEQLDKLLPCPFCGGEAEIDTRQMFRHYRTGEPLEQVSVYCTTCSADISHYPGDLDCDREGTIEICLAAWNTRAPFAQAERAIEAEARVTALEAAMEEIRDEMQFPNQLEAGFVHGKPTMKDLQKRVEIAASIARTALHQKGPDHG